MLIALKSLSSRQQFPTFPAVPSRLFAAHGELAVLSSEHPGEAEGEREGCLLLIPFPMAPVC